MSSKEHVKEGPHSETRTAENIQSWLETETTASGADSRFVSETGTTTNEGDRNEAEWDGSIDKTLERRRGSNKGEIPEETSCDGKCFRCDGISVSLSLRLSVCLCLSV